MSKAEELAKWLERGYPSPTEKNIATHLRALDASHQRLKNALQHAVCWHDQLRPSEIASYRAALKQAKELE